MITGTINVVELFAGCGGFAQGLRTFNSELDSSAAPFRSVSAVEMNPAAAATFAANFGATEIGGCQVFNMDIAHWDPHSVGIDVDVILGGPPCQGFSSLGKADPDDPRNALWREYMRIVQILQPKIFVIENVDRFLKSPELSTLYEASTAAGTLSSYHLKSEILNSADYGVAQTRKRAIVLGTRRDLISGHPSRQPLTHPGPTHGKISTEQEGALFPKIGHHLKPWVPVSTVFNRTPAKATTTTLPSRTCKPLGRILPGAFSTKELHFGRNPTPHSVKRYAAIPPGGNRHDLPRELSTESWRRHTSGSHDVMGRMYFDRPSVTIRTEFFKPEKGRYLHPFENRPITHFEAALIQDFPMDYWWCGSKIEIARQIGNAVPVGLANSIARQIHQYLQVAG